MDSKKAVIATWMLTGSMDQLVMRMTNRSMGCGERSVDGFVMVGSVSIATFIDLVLPVKDMSIL